MIQIKYDLSKGFQRISLSGHAGYAEPGSDIVCAGVSSLFFSLYAVLLNKEIEFSCSFEGEEKYIECQNINADHYFEMFICGVKGIAEKYPGNVNLEVCKS